MTYQISHPRNDPVPRSRDRIVSLGYRLTFRDALLVDGEAVGLVADDHAKWLALSIDPGQDRDHAASIFAFAFWAGIKAAQRRERRRRRKRRRAI